MSGTKKDASELTVLYALGIYINPGMSRLLVEYLREASTRYKALKILYLYWWPDVDPEPFVQMCRESGIHNLEVYTDDMMASPQFGAKLGWKNASLWKSFRHNLGTLGRVTQLLKREKVDIVHMILTEYQAHFLVSWAARRAKVKGSVLSFTGIAPPNSKKKRFFNSITDRKLDRVITASEIDMHTAAEEAFPTAPKSICRGFGLAPDLFTGGELNPGKIRAEFAIPDDSPVIGTTTRIAPGKGQDHLIRALPKVIQAFPDLKVIILGGRYDKDQPYTDELKDLADEMSVRGNIIFTGERKDAADIFATYTFAVHLPDYDHLPFGVVECGALGIPTIATSVGGIPEIIQDGYTGIMLDTHDPEIVAGRIIDFLKDDIHRKETGLNMRRFVFDRFNLEKLVDRVMNLYTDLINGDVQEVYD